MGGGVVFAFETWWHDSLGHDSVWRWKMGDGWWTVWLGSGHLLGGKGFHKQYMAPCRRAHWGRIIYGRHRATENQRGQL